LYPQGFIKQVKLQQAMEEAAPFYLKHNKPIYIRKNLPNELSTLEQARVRFEAKLQQEQELNNKTQKDYQTYIDETNKFQELKALKDQQNKQWVKGVLEQQIAEERRKKLESRENRLNNVGGEMTFGPKETEDTIMFS
jgi:hypothetical protein